MQAHQAWGLTKGSLAARVAAVDTGIDNSHPDLPLVLAQHDFVNNVSNTEDDNDHGTDLAGTIRARTNHSTGVAGANWNVSLMAGKVLSRLGFGTNAGVANGIIWAADNGAKVINLSLGGGRSLTLKNAIDYAWNKGVALACAAGNDGRTAETYPGADPNCIAVAATDETDSNASCSNYGSWVHVAGPGIRILSTTPHTSVFINQIYGDKKVYDSEAGTSMATPHVAGLAALIWASGPCSTNTCVRSRIETRADAISGTGTCWTYGRINCDDSLLP